MATPAAAVYPAGLVDPEAAVSTTTSDPNDPRLTHGIDPADAPPVEQAEAYLVLSEQERAKGFVRPVRTAYWHEACGKVTTMAQEIAETFARDPGFYGATYCAHCQRHPAVAEFHWVDPANPERQSPTDPLVGS